MAVNRFYSSQAQPMALTAGINSAATALVVDAVVGLPLQYPYVVVIDPDLANEEIVLVTAVSLTTLTVTRGYDGASPQSHGSGAIVRHMATAIDFREAQEHMAAPTGVHGLPSGDAVVGLAAVQTLTHKTIDSSENTLTIRTAALQDGAVTNPKIANDAITAAKIASGAVGADEIASGAVGTDELANNAVTSAKIDSTVAAKTYVDTATDAVFATSIGSNASGWSGSTGGDASRAALSNHGTLVSLNLQLRSDHTITSSSTGNIIDDLMFTLSAAYRPTQAQLVSAVYRGPSGFFYPGVAKVETDGKVYLCALSPNLNLGSQSSGTTSVFVNITYQR